MGPATGGEAVRGVGLHLLQGRVPRTAHRALCALRTLRLSADLLYPRRAEGRARMALLCQATVCDGVLGRHLPVRVVAALGTNALPAPGAPPTIWGMRSRQWDNVESGHSVRDHRTFHRSDNET